MTHSNPLVSIPANVLSTLRLGLERVLGDQAAPLLQEAGFSSGDRMYDEFTAWVRAEGGVNAPEDLDSENLGEMLSGFFAARGWGNVTVDRLGAAALVLDAPDWAEASMEPTTDIPSCHVTTGLLAAFLGRLADQVVAVMEVECRSRGDGQCRFLIGSPDTLQTVFDGMSRGTDYEHVLTAAAESA